MTKLANVFAKVKEVGTKAMDYFVDMKVEENNYAPINPEPATIYNFNEFRAIRMREESEVVKQVMKVVAHASKVASELDVPVRYVSWETFNKAITVNVETNANHKGVRQSAHIDYSSDNNTHKLGYNELIDGIPGLVREPQGFKETEMYVIVKKNRDYDLTSPNPLTVTKEVFCYVPARYMTKIG